MTKTVQEPVNKLVVTLPSERVVHGERVFNAPRAKVWRAMTEPELVAQWWGRGNKVVVEKLEPHKGGRWRFVEHSDHGVHGFEGRFREVTPIERIVQTFEWDGMPGYPAVQTMVLEDLGDGRTRVVSDTMFYTTEERDGMVGSGMEQGWGEAYAALDRVLAALA